MKRKQIVGHLILVMIWSYIIGSIFMQIGDTPTSCDPNTLKEAFEVCGVFLLIAVLSIITFMDFTE